ncbi:MAG: metallophosphoesterase [Verrucomicrobia bacterium]|nr:metallophosphoesterase [Verrucomicrobiota bacterium]
MRQRFVVIADPHVTTRETDRPRRGDIGALLLRRAVGRINQLIKPDIVLLAGDLIDDGAAADAVERTEQVRAIVDTLDCPYLAIPGNHDLDPYAFYRIFRRPADIVDVKGARYIAFVDPEEPDYNARRTPRDLQRMRGGHHKYSGPSVLFQHVPLFPPGTTACPVNLVNADEVIATMREVGALLAVGGHWHEGLDLVERQGMQFLTAPALCEPPFPFLEVEIDGKDVRVTRHELKMAERLGLIDCHVHTQFAYCADDIVADRIPALATDFGLAGVGIAEHTHGLYFARSDCARGAWCRDGIESARDEESRVPEFLTATRLHLDAAHIGFEVDCDNGGRPLLREADRPHAGFLLGAMHTLPELKQPAPDAGRMADEFLSMLQRFAASGIQALAHPFRIFHRAKVETPERLFSPAVDLLREHGVAAEINCQGNTPPHRFFRMCLDAGVKFVLGSDAHSLAQIGELAPALRFLRELGCDANLDDVLIDPRGANRL